MSNENKKKIDKYRENLKHSEQKQLLDEIYDPNDKTVDKEIKDSWKELSRIAKFKFPEGARHLDLTASQRLVAIAYCLGWKQIKIAKASGLKAATICRWLKREDVVHFMDEFNMKNNPDKDVNVDKKLKAMEYNAAQFMEDLFNDPSPELGRLKLDAVKALFKLTREEVVNVNHTGDAFASLLESVKSMKGLTLTPEDEADLFEEEQSVH